MIDLTKHDNNSIITDLIEHPIIILQLDSGEEFSVKRTFEGFSANVISSFGEYKFPISESLFCELISSQFEGYNTSKEIERRWIAKIPDNVSLGHGVLITQWYLLNGTEDGESIELRIRFSQNSYTLGIKRGNGLSRSEKEYSLSNGTMDEHELDQFPYVSKTRYKIPDQSGNIVELNLFHELNNQIITAEVEFDSCELAKLFEVPAFLLKEVTDDSKYESSSLAHI